MQAARDAVAGSVTDIASLLGAVPGTTLEDWGACGQLQGEFLPAFNYRPRQSAQYALALGSAQGEAVPERRAIIGIEPLTLTVGEHLTPDVAESVPLAAEAVLTLVRKWASG